MDTDQYKLDLTFAIDPTWDTMPPAVKIRLDAECLWDDILSDTRTFVFHKNLPQGTHSLEIELCNKSDWDPCQALTIQNFALGQIQSERFLWQGVYTPRYPEPWASEQSQQGIKLKSRLRNTDHLGWNGVWQLEFTVPVFTWIHQIENLGWIYD